MAELSTGFLLPRGDTANLRALAQAMRREVEKLDPRVPVTTVRMKEDHLTVALVGPLVATAIAAAFGLLALVLATTGVYSVISPNAHPWTDARVRHRPEPQDRVERCAPGRRELALPRVAAIAAQWMGQSRVGDFGE